MIHGATTRRASAQRSSTEATTSATSQSQAGTRAKRLGCGGGASWGRPSWTKPSSSRRTPSSCAKGVPGSIPTSAAASAISRTTASATTGPPAASSKAATYEAATPCTSCSRRTCAPAASLIAWRVASLEASNSSEAASAGTSSSSTGTFIAASSGSSANQPTSLTRSGFPSASARIALPDVSPIVGERNETQTSQAAITDHRRSSST